MSPSETPSDSPRPRTRDDVVFRRLGEEFAILDPSGQVVHVLNPSAAAVWVLCDGSRSVEEIATEVREAFGLGDDVDLRPDVDEALTAFADKGLLS